MPTASEIVTTLRKAGKADADIMAFVSHKLNQPEPVVDAFLRAKGITLAVTSTLPITEPTTGQETLPSTLSAASNEPRPASTLDTMTKNFKSNVRDLGAGLGTIAAAGARTAGDTIKTGLQTAGEVLTYPAEAVSSLAQSALTQTPPTPTRLGTRLSGLQYGKAAHEVFGTPEGRAVMKTVALAPLESLMKSLRHPVESFVENPLFTIMDWSALSSFASAGLGKGAQLAAKGAGLEPQLVKAVSDAAAHPFMKMAESAATQIASTPKGKALFHWLSESPAGRVVPDYLATEEVAMGRTAKRAAAQLRVEGMMKRTQAIESATDLLANLTPEELEAFIPISQGLAMTIPRNARRSEQFQQALDAWRRLGQQEATQLFPALDITPLSRQFRMDIRTKYGVPPLDPVDRVAFQPLALRSGKVTPEDYATALRGMEGSKDAIKKIDRAVWEVKQEQVQLLRQDLATRFPGLSKAEQQLAVEHLMPDPMYFPQIHETRLKWSDFLPSRWFQQRKAGAQHGRAGYEGYIQDPERALALHRMDVANFMHNQDIIQQIGHFASEWDGVRGHLNPGWVPFAPHGYLRFYRQKFDLERETLKAIKAGRLSVDDAAESAIKAVFPHETTDILSAAKELRLFQVPEKVMQAFHKEFIPPGDAMFKDLSKLLRAPTQMWRMMVLNLSPRWVLNNTMGNSFFAALAGTSPTSAFKASQERWMQVVPYEARYGFRTSERLVPSREAGSFYATPGKLVSSLQRVVSKPAEVNAKIEDFFRSTVYIDQATKMAHQKIMQEVGTGFLNLRPRIKQFLGVGPFSDDAVRAKIASFDPRTVQDTLFNMNEWMFNYLRLTPVERHYVRSIFPFWAFWRELHRFAIRAPFIYPGRTALVRSLATAGLEVERAQMHEAGITPDMVRSWERGRVLWGQEQDEDLTQLSGRAMIPLTQVGERPGVTPIIQFGMERLTGRKMLTGKAFTSPDIREENGEFYQVDPVTRKVSRVDGPPSPPVIAHLVRTFLPHVQSVELALKSNPQYDTAGIFESKPRPVLKPNAHAVKERLAQVIGIPVKDVDMVLYILRERQRIKMSRTLNMQYERYLRALEEEERKAKP